ncbi:MAG TPA: Omp28-related outer membrane protein, partial [Flavobacteriales bacterium]|nr:Omp28-related outer membrane protein [Flavobacteriales bacterium]
MRTFLLLTSLSVTTVVSAQVSQLPQSRTLLLEEFTAINCGNCPAGHVISNGIISAHPDDAVLVNIHAGSLAVPSAVQPDFRNTFGTQIHSNYGISFTPQALLNRRPYNGATALSSGNWVNASSAVLALPSPVNLAATTDYDNATRELTVHVEYYYTGYSPGGDDRIMVLLTEDHLNAYQQNYGVGGPYANYDHRHLLRSYITALAGDPITSTSSGSTEVRTYSYTVPAGFNTDNCRVVAFVAEGATSGFGEVYQVITAPAVGTSAGVDDVTREHTLRIYPLPANDAVNVLLLPSSEARRLMLTDAGGRSVATMNVPAGVGSLSLPTAGLPNGMYLIAIEGFRPQ